MKQVNTQLLWRQMQKGNQEAFASLFKIYYSDLKAYGTKLTANPDIAQEGVQLLFLKIWEKKDRLSTIQHPKSYLLTAYRTTLLDLLKEQKKRRIQLTKLPFQFNKEELPLLTETLETASILHLVNQLSDKQREIIFLKFYNNLSYQEIAEVLGINYQTVRNYMSKSIALLRKKINFSQKK